MMDSWLLRGSTSVLSVVALVWIRARQKSSGRNKLQRNVHGVTRRGIARSGPRQEQGNCKVCRTFLQEQPSFRQDAKFVGLPQLNTEEGRVVCGLKRRLINATGLAKPPVRCFFFLVPQSVLPDIKITVSIVLQAGQR